MNNGSKTNFMQGFHTGFLPWGRGGEGGNIDACKRCIRVLVHPLDFNEILDIFKDKKCPLKSIIMLPIVAVLRQL